MAWSGTLEFGNSWVAFQGRSADNAMHAHAALQVTLSVDGMVTMRGATRTVSAGALLVTPGTPHAIDSTGVITLLLIEPQSPIARLFAASNLRGIAPLPPELSRLVNLEQPLARSMDRICTELPSAAPVLDARLVAALRFLEADISTAAVARAAGAAGLSTSRLRALAAKELGTPLSNWVTWRKLERAGKRLAAGASLAAAAHDAGFADQAHFTRTVRKVLGITPTMLGALAQ